MLPFSDIVLMLLTLGLLFPKEKEGPFSVIKHKQNAGFKLDLTESRDDKVFQERETRKKRQNLIIVAHGRSGSTFLGNIFNHHPNVFYLFEPYQTVERLHGSVAPENQEYQEKAFQWISMQICNIRSRKRSGKVLSKEIRSKLQSIKKPCAAVTTFLSSQRHRFSMESGELVAT